MTKIRVMKLGGSLLLRPDWPQKLRQWIGSQSTAVNLLIVGGGEIVEAVRHLDRQHQLNSAFAHWLCVDLLAATARLAGQLLPQMTLLENSEQLHRVLSGGSEVANDSGYLVQIAAFYSSDAPSPLLPEDWNTTSDALAAWLARQVHADELILFKSVDPPSIELTVTQLAENGIVDRAITKIVDGQFPLRIVNLATPTCLLSPFSQARRASQ